MKLLTLITTIALYVIASVDAYKSIYSGAECESCLTLNTTWAAVCNSQYSSNVAYCCNADDFVKSPSCIYSPLCSWNISSPTDALTNSSMRQMACPHEKLPCGTTNPDYRINLDESREVEIGRLFDVGDVCHYSFGA